MNRRNLFKQLIGICVGTTAAQAIPKTGLTGFTGVTGESSASGFFPPSIETFDDVKKALRVLADQYTNKPNTPETQEDLKLKAISITREAIRSRVVVESVVICDYTNNISPQYPLQMSIFVKLNKGLEYKELKYKIYNEKNLFS